MKTSPLVKFGLVVRFLLFALLLLVLAGLQDHAIAVLAQFMRPRLAMLVFKAVLLAGLVVFLVSLISAVRWAARRH